MNELNEWDEKIRWKNEMNGWDEWMRWINGINKWNGWMRSVLIKQNDEMDW